jgi:hypothetical protein
MEGFDLYEGRLFECLDIWFETEEWCQLILQIDHMELILSLRTFLKFAI